MSGCDEDFERIIELARHASKNPNGGHLTFGPAAFNAFLRSIKDGQLDG